MNAPVVRGDGGAPRSGILDSPLVTVAMPAYNAELWIARAIESVLGQTLSDWELIVVNDGSTDGTAAVVRTFRDSRVRMVCQDNGGAALARNTAMRHARGRYVALLDADDWYEPRHLERTTGLAILVTERSNRHITSRIASSSIESEPRRSCMVPSSTTVTPGGDLLAHQAGEGGRLLAVEVALEPVADRLVQHHAGPAGAEHHVHLAGRRRHRVEIDQRLAHRLVDRALPGLRRDEALIGFAAAVAVGAGFLAVAVADHHRRR